MEFLNTFFYIKTELRKTSADKYQLKIEYNTSSKISFVRVNLYDL